MGAGHNYNPSSKLLIYKNGTRVTYESFPDAAFSTTLFRPKQIKDTNGNFITITYRTGTGRNQQINTITDTLNRVITFNYDANGLLTSITQGTKTHATFTWNAAYLLKYNFAPALVVSDSPANNSTQKVLTGCTYANGTKYSFIYGDWGIVTKVERRSSTNALRSYVSYNFQTSAIQLSEHPSWTTETVYDGVSTLNTAYSVTKVAGLVSTVTTAYDDVQRIVIVGNPQGPSDPTPPSTVTQFDYLGRTVSVTPPGNSGQYQYAYSGNVVTITDPAGKQRRNTTDGLGRLVKVEEPGFGDGIPGKGSVTISGSEQVTAEEFCDDFPPFNCHTIITDYDTGSVSITVNGVTKTVGYGQGSTSGNLATALATAINGNASYPVSAGVTGTTIYLTAKVANAASNYSLSASSQTTKPLTYGGPSFFATRSGPTLTGGWDPSGPDTATLTTPMPTTYTYDVLDNLLTVAQAQGWPQGGVTPPPQNRSYSYDSMSRLTQAVPARDVARPDSHKAQPESSQVQSRVGNSCELKISFEKSGMLQESFTPVQLQESRGIPVHRRSVIGYRNERPAHPLRPRSGTKGEKRPPPRICCPKSVS